MKYIIDTDPGIDDAIGICFGVKNNLDILGFTLGSGNIPIEKSSNNLKFIENFLSINKPIYKGKCQNKSNRVTAEYAHGFDGLGYAVFPVSKKKIEREAAENFIIRSAKKYKNNLTLVCLGPLTNLANVIRKNKKIYKYLKHIVIMGATYNPGKPPYHEFNVKIDPESANLVFNTPFEDIKVITHEIGVKSFIDKDYIQGLKNSEDIVSRFISLIAEKYIEFSFDHYGVIGLCSPDPTTIASLIDPEIITYIPCKIDVITSGINKGICLIKDQENSNTQIATNLNVKKFNSLFKKTFK